MMSVCTCSALINPKVDFDVDLHIDRLASLERWREPIPSNCFQCVVIQAHAQVTGYPYFLRVALSVDDQRDYADTLVLGSPRLFSVCLG